MNTIVKILVNEDGDIDESGHWHLSSEVGDSNAILCTSEVYNEEGEIGAEGSAYGRTKHRERGGVTCPRCMEEILRIKGYRF